MLKTKSFTDLDAFKNCPFCDVDLSQIELSDFEDVCFVSSNRLQLKYSFQWRVEEPGCDGIIVPCIISCALYFKTDPSRGSFDFASGLWTLRSDNLCFYI